MKKTKQPEKKQPVGISKVLAGAFLFFIPFAVLLLAILNLRKTNLTSWAVSAAVIAASLHIGRSLRKK